MLEKQRTIKDPVSYSGVGLHTGNSSTITFHPAPENYGYRFVRTDVPNSPEIPALVDYVTDIARGTTLSVDGTHVHTVEHVLAALVGLQIDNCKMELTANEPPVGDGSALPFVEALRTTEIIEQKAPRDYLVLDEQIRYLNDVNGTDILALPNDDFRITVMIDYANPALGSQHTGLFDLEKEFVTEFCSARTFCFLNEVESLYNQGLIKGGNFDNSVVIVDREMSEEELQQLLAKLGIEGNAVLGGTGILNDKKLRYRNEPARHKLLDMLGDLALIGVPMKAQILAARPGHASNIEFARKVRKHYLQKKALRRLQPKYANGVVMDINAIMKVMPHRYPFLLVDRIIEFDTDNNRIVGYKNVTINEPFFPGHFPDRPVMPGVLILESMAQCGCMLLLNLDGMSTENKLVFFMAINNAKFRRPVTPGDQLVLDVKMTARRFNTISLHADAYVGETLVAEADLSAAIVDKEA